jgi:O-antigen ligase
MTTFLDRALRWLGLAFLSLPVLIGPWFFGAWEMWWFWPFTTFIFVAAFFCALRLLLHSCVGHRACETSKEIASPVQMRLLYCAVPFLVYAFVRSVQAPVYMDAERSFLLFLTPWLLAAVLLCGVSGRQRRILFWLVVANVVFLGLYGICNHLITGSKRVLWAEGYSQYYNDGRATGSFFCPDHYAGAMELGICLGLGLLLGGGVRSRNRVAGIIIIVIGIVGVTMSKSRGAGLTGVVIFIATAIWGMTYLPRAARWWWRASVCSLLAMAVLLVVGFSGDYVTRFAGYFGWNTARQRTPQEAIAVMSKHVTKHSRYHMFNSAIRAWQTERWIGIGPGMHKNLWPHFAPSSDGNRDAGVWPTFANNHYVSNEVHNDWLELLEEFGIAGVVLFLVPFAAVCAALFGALRHDTRRDYIRTSRDAYGRETIDDAMLLGGFLAMIAMSFHSLGDFNLQIPGVNWLFGAIIALSLGTIGTKHGDKQSP